MSANEQSTNPSSNECTNNKSDKSQVFYEGLLRKKVHHLRRSIKIIEHLSGNPINESTLSKAILFLDKDQYDDVIHERVSVKNCGFPLCSNSIVHIPKQKYKICTRSNQVIDISERKDFCSGLCYHRSHLIRENIPESTVYTRTEEEVHNIYNRLRDIIESVRDIPAKNLIIQAGKIEENKLRNEKNEKNSDDSEDDYIEKLLSREDAPYIDKEDAHLYDSHFSDKEESEDDFDDPLYFKKEFKCTREKSPPLRKQFAEKVSSLTDSISNQLDICSTTFEPQNGDAVVKDRISDWFTPKTAKYLRSTNSVTTDKTHEDYSLKVKAFMNGGKFKSQDMTSIPLVDSISPNLVRMKIIMERLSQFLPEILSAIDLSMSEIYGPMKMLIETFNLTSKNLSLKPNQWKQIILCLLYCLKHREPVMLKIVDGGMFDQLVRLHFDEPDDFYSSCDSLCC